MIPPLAPDRLRLCLATHNAHKVAELRALLAHHAPDLARRIELVSLDDLGVYEAAIEDGPDCRSNALIKARHAAQHTGLWSLADDSGLEVDALHGAPGVHSARFGGPPAAGQSQDARNRQVLLARLSEVPAEGRAARFVCVLCLHPPLPSPSSPSHAAAQADRACFAEGFCQGYLLLTEYGHGGFGYDPLFVPAATELAQAGLPPDRRGLSFGQLSADEKNRLSHRTRALVALLPTLTGVAAPASSASL